MAVDFKTYIRTNGEAHCVSLFGVSVWTVRKWRTGDRLPSVQKANEIVAKTGGEVSLAGIYAPRIGATDVPPDRT